MVPKEILPLVQENIRNELPAIELYRTGVAKSPRRAQAWQKAVKEDAYRVVTSSGHFHTEVDWEYDPAKELEDIILTAENQYASIMRRLRANDDLFMVVKTDEHIPDQDPVAEELALKCSQYWLPDRENSLVLNLGDTWDFPYISRHNNTVPFWLLYPKCHSKVDYMSLTMHTFAQIEKEWASVSDNRVQLGGNHCARFLNYAFKQSSETAIWSISGFYNQVAKTGVVYLGSGHDKLDLVGNRFMHGEIARKGAGSSVRQQIINDGFTYPMTVQGHVHRHADIAISRAMGTHVLGYEIGCLQNNPPGWSPMQMDWQHGLMLIRLSVDNEPEINNLLFHHRTYQGKQYLCAYIEGEEIRVEKPQSYISIGQRRRGELEALWEVQNA